MSRCSLQGEGKFSAGMDRFISPISFGATASVLKGFWPDVRLHLSHKHE